MSNLWLSIILAKPYPLVNNSTLFFLMKKEKNVYWVYVSFLFNTVKNKMVMATWGVGEMKWPSYPDQQRWAIGCASSCAAQKIEKSNSGLGMGMGKWRAEIGWIGVSLGKCTVSHVYSICSNGTLRPQTTMHLGIQCGSPPFPPIPMAPHQLLFTHGAC